MPEMILWDDEYTGPRWTYGLTYRPLGAAQVPAGWIINPGRPVPHAGFAFGTVDYPRPLTDAEVSRFELTLIRSGG